MNFDYVYPRAEHIVFQQQNYIQTFVDSFEQALISPTYENDAGFRYDEYIDLTSFADTYLMNEFCKNVDAYRLSSYFYKQKDSDGGKMFAGPVWDFNLAFGNANYCDGASPFGWMYYQDCDGTNPFWWDRLLNDPEFLNLVRCRWQEHRSTFLQFGTIVQYLDDRIATLGEATNRNFERWPVLGSYVWPNPQPVADTYQEAVDNLGNWILTRLTWMDNNIEETCINTGISLPEVRASLKISPNPANEYIIFTEEIYASAEAIEILDALGNQVYFQSKREADFDFKKIDIIEWNAGCYFVTVFQNGNRISSKFIKM